MNNTEFHVHSTEIVRNFFNKIPIEKMNIKYTVIRNVFDKLDIVPCDLLEHIIKYISDNEYDFDQDEM